MAMDINREVMDQAMIEGFKSHFRAALKAHLLEAAEPLIEDAIKTAMKTFDVSVQSYWTPMRFGETMEVILRDVRNERNPRQPIR